MEHLEKISELIFLKILVEDRKQRQGKNNRSVILSGEDRDTYMAEFCLALV